MAGRKYGEDYELHGQSRLLSRLALVPPLYELFSGCGRHDGKGAVLVCAGGAFQFRSDRMEGTPVAQWFARHGYQAFVVNYRVRPYTMEEGSLDLARAIRFVRRHASITG